MTTVEVSSDVLQAQAREAYRESVAAELPLTGAALGKMFDRSARWGRDRVAEARAEDAAAAERQPQDVSGTEAAADVLPATHPGTAVSPPRSWPVLLLALPAFVSIWAGWVGLGELTGFGPVNLLPGIGDGWVINSAITLPIGVESYAAYALHVWLSGRAYTDTARRFAMWSAIGSLLLGMAGQVAYHLMKADGVTVAPWQITTFVSCLPVVILGCGAALAHLLHNTNHEGNQ